MVVLLSRIQFAFTVAFHFLFVPLTIGLILLTAIFETLNYKTKNPMYRRISDFWGEIFVINFAVGIVTGLVMSVQFGTNWSQYSVFMGDVFGSPLALEALLAFFLESTFAGIWIFRRKKLSDGMRMIVVWLIVLGTSISAVWIITANGFMQHPVGYKLAEDGSKVLLTDFGAVVSNPYSLFMLAHTLLAAILLGSFFVIGVSAYHFKKGSAEIELFKHSVKVAVILGLIVSILIPIEGSSYEKYLGKADVQPMKGAILRDRIELNEDDQIEIKKGGIFESAIDARSAATLEKAAAGMQEIDRKPPVKFIYINYMIMRGLGTLFILFLFLLLIKKKLLWRSTRVQNLAMWFIPLPYIAITSGWIVAEVGRQPWMVYNLMTVEDGVSNVPVSNVIFSLFTLVVFYAILFVMDFYLIRKRAILGPDPEGGAPNAAA